LLIFCQIIDTKLDKILVKYLNKNVEYFSTKTSKIMYNSWNGDPKFKAKFIELIKQDKENERIVQDFGYWDPECQKGCNIGCGEKVVCQLLNLSFEDKRHEFLEEKLSIPSAIFYLGDTLFEGLSNSKAIDFVVDFYRAIPVGKDLTLVQNKFEIEVLTNPDFGSRQYADEQIKKAIDRVVELHQKTINGEQTESAAWSAVESEARLVAESEARSAAWHVAWSAARYAAWAAAESATRSTAKSAAWHVARSAAWAAAWDTAWDTNRSAAEYHARSAAEYDARIAAYTKMADKFVKILKSF
jgi:hypothetical protein